MSQSEWDSWNPMEEDFKKGGSSRRFEDPIGVNDNICKLALFVRNIPENLSEQELVEIMADGGRKVTSVHIPKKFPGNATYGFVNFENEKDAASALNAWNKTPPYCLSLTFARENSNRKNGPRNEKMFGGKGRGMRIDLHGEEAVASKNIKITKSTQGEERVVTIDEPAPVVTESESTDHTAVNVSSVPECKPPKLFKNPFFNCFRCGKEAKYSCGKCRKPYCSPNCQAADWNNHQYLCKVATGVSSSLLESFKELCTLNHDSSYVSDASSSDLEQSMNPKSSVKCLPDTTFNNDEVVKKLPSPKPSTVPAVSSGLHPKRLPLARMIAPPVEKLTVGQVDKVIISHIESPDKFWVQLLNTSAFKELEQKLSSLQKVSLSGDQGTCFCSVEYQNKTYRGLVKEQSMYEWFVYLLDYGETVKVSKNKVYELPEQYRKCPMQAICCKLVDSKSQSIEWSSEDILSFKLLAERKAYKALLLRNSGEINEVSLINEDGNNLYSILLEARSGQPVRNSVSPVKDGIPPSVWSKVKPGSLVKMVYVHHTEMIIWSYLFVNEGDIQEAVELENLLKNYSGEDFSKCAEEGDFAVAYSPSFNEFYRCIVLKRNAKSFFVRYIDFGNEEEVSNLTVLSPELAEKYCYLVSCEKPDTLSLESFMSCIQSIAEYKVKSVQQDAMELLLDVEGQKVVLSCHPCYKSASAKDVALSKNVEKTYAQKPLSKTPPKTTKPNVPKASDPKIKAEKVLKPKSLDRNITHKVNVVFIKTMAELFVQLSSEEAKLNAMAIELNEFCNSNTSGYDPQVGDVVTCKHSDGFWYRGLVQKKNGSDYHVLYVDYGEDKVVQSENLQILPDKFASPMYSICVSLSQMKNSDVSKALLQKLLSECWDMKIINDKNTPIEVMLSLNNSSIADMVSGEKRSKAALKQKKLPSDQAVKVKIVHEDPNFVYLVLVSDLKCLEEMAAQLSSLKATKAPSQLVIDNVYCGLFKTDSMWYRVAVLDKVSADQFKVVFIDYGNCETLSINDLRDLPDTLFAQPIYCIPVKVQNREGLVLDLDDEYTVEVIKVAGDVQEVKFVNLYQAPKLSSLQKRSLVDGMNEILICYSEGDVYYCQLASDSDAIVELFTKLRRSVSHESGCPTNLHVGDVVAARSCCDDNWYRAAITSDKKYPTYEVLFFDYGSKEDVLKENMRGLPEDLAKYPVFAIPIQIKNIEVAKKDTSILTANITVKKIGMNKKISIVEIRVEDSLPKVSSLTKASLSELTPSKVSVCYIGDSGVFVQPESLEADLRVLTTKLQKASDFEGLPRKLELHDVVCAKASDSIWYRACVQEVIDSKNVKVTFVDFGNPETVSVDNVKMLPPELVSYPIASICVELNLNLLEEYLQKDMSSFDVKVIDKKGDVMVIDFVEVDAAEKPVAKAYEPFNLSKLKQTTFNLNEVCEVIFINCTGATHYAYKSEHASIMKNVTALLKASTPIAISHVPTASEILLCRRSDNLLYRGCVDLFDSVRNFGTVFFIDLGVTEDISKANMFCHPGILETFPVFVIKVSAQSDSPIILEKPYYVKCVEQVTDGTPVLKVYHRHMSLKRKVLPLKETKTVLCCFKEKEFVFVQDLADGESVGQVQLLLGSSELSDIPFKLSVGELVCAKSQLDNSWYRGLVEEIVAADEYTIFFIDFGNCEVVKQQNLRCIPSSVVDFPSFCLPVVFSCPKDAESVGMDQVYSVEALSLPSNNVQTVKLVKPEQSMDINENIALNLEVSSQYKYSVSEFVPFSAGEQDIAIYSVVDAMVFGAPFLKANIEANLNLIEQITQFCSTQGTSITADCQPEPDDLVLAKFSEDGQWYRAAVIENQNPLFICLFVDYGNTELIHISNLKTMEKQFMSLPIQAHQCSLIGFKPLSGKESALYEELKNFTIFLNPEPLSACVEIKNDEFLLSVPRITAHLVEKHLAVAAS